MNQGQQHQFVEVSRLRVGLYVYLDLGWMAHPFPLNNFRISSPEQIDTIRNLGIARIRYSPEQSLPEALQELHPDAPSGGLAQTLSQHSAGAAQTEVANGEAAQKRWREALSEQNRSLQQCERRFAEATRTYRAALEKVRLDPKAAADSSSHLVQDFLSHVVGDQESCIRLLSEASGDRASMHSINVTVIAVMLARALKMSEQEIADVGLGALLHDIGKIELPDRVRWRSDNFTAAESRFYQDHVGQGVALGRKMGLGAGTLLALAQHHEYVDGTGFPLKLTGDKLSVAGRIVAMVNRYEGLCNPNNPSQALTPHEALRAMFSQQKAKFDAEFMQAFIRMMGVYPPGSVIQLNDERYALVVSVNSMRPLKPRVLIHDPNVPRHEALLVDLESEPGLGIRRSLKPLQLPAATMDYLSPRTRLCYFFERAREPVFSESSMGILE